MLFGGVFVGSRDGIVVVASCARNGGAGVARGSCLSWRNVAAVSVAWRWAGRWCACSVCRLGGDFVLGFPGYGIDVVTREMLDIGLDRR